MAAYRSHDEVQVAFRRGKIQPGDTVSGRISAATVLAVSKAGLWIGQERHGTVWGQGREPDFLRLVPRAIS
jgi:hypothetical protein